MKQQTGVQLAIADLRKEYSDYTIRLEPIPDDDTSMQLVLYGVPNNLVSKLEDELYQWLRASRLDLESELIPVIVDADDTAAYYPECDNSVPIAAHFSTPA